MVPAKNPLPSDSDLTDQMRSDSDMDSDLLYGWLVGSGLTALLAQKRLYRA